MSINQAKKQGNAGLAAINGEFMDSFGDGFGHDFGADGAHHDGGYSDGSDHHHVDPGHHDIPGFDHHDTHHPHYEVPHDIEIPDVPHDIPPHSFDSHLPHDPHLPESHTSLPHDAHVPHSTPHVPPAGSPEARRAAAENIQNVMNAAERIGQEIEEHGEQVLDAAQAAKKSSWAKRFSELGKGTKIAIVGGTVAVGAVLGYWAYNALQSKPKQDPAQAQSQSR